MALELTASNEKVIAVYRFIGKDIFIKTSNTQYANNLISQLRAKGSKVLLGRGWIKADIIGDHTIAKLGAVEIDTEIDTPDVIEQKFFNFFKLTLEKGGFNIQETRRT